MSILYSPEDRLLTLQTSHTTYQMDADERGFLRHLYYGPRADGADFRYLHRRYDRGYSGNPAEMRYDRSFSQDTMPQEYTGFNAGDFRTPAFCAVHADGSFAADLRYVGHEIIKGKYALPGLPAAFDRDGNAMTLIITLQDTATPLRIRLYYGVFEELDMTLPYIWKRRRRLAWTFLSASGNCCTSTDAIAWSVKRSASRWGTTFRRWNRGAARAVIITTPSQSFAPPTPANTLANATALCLSGPATTRRKSKRTT